MKKALINHKYKIKKHISSRYCIPTKLSGLKLMIFLIFMVLTTILPADTIRKIMFNQSGYEYSKNMLRYNLQSRKRTEFNKKVLDEDIKRLFETGYFINVKADVKKTPDGQVDITFYTESRPKIKKIVIEGNKKYETKKLNDKITLEKGFPLNDKKLLDTLNNLRDFYKQEGYLDALVTYEIKTNEDSSVNVIFLINEQLRLKVNSVNFTGNTVFYKVTLRKVVQTGFSMFSWLFNVGLFDEQLIEQDKIRLRKRYWEKGYLDFRVKNVTATPLPKNPEYVNVTFQLEEGEPYTVGNIVINGNERFTDDELLPLLHFKEGDTFDVRIEQKDIDSIKRKYSPLGYLDLKCEAIRNPDYATHTVDIQYDIIEGRTYDIHDIIIKGNHVTKDKVIRRELPMQPGQPVDKFLLGTSKARLKGLGYFSKVTIVTQDTANPGQKDIVIEVEEQKTTRLTLGGGVSSEDGLMGSISFTQSNFDLFDPSNYFRGGGQRLKILAEVGTERQRGEISFIEPWLFDIPLRMKLEGYYRNRFYDNWREEHAGGFISFKKRFFDDFTSVELGHRLEAVGIHKLDNDYNSKYFRGEEGTDFMSKTSLILSRDTRNDLNNPTSGYLLKILGEFNAATKVYYKVEFKASNYYPFFEDLFVLHTGIKYGVLGRIAGSSESDMAPLYERYFLGGGDSIRGFPYREISPVDDDEHFYGGQTMLLGNLELTHPIYDFVRGAVFMDCGGVWKDPWSMNFNKFNIGLGYGLRVKLPQFPAPIALDLAYPILNRQDHVKSKLRLSFSMGFAW
jgi:outer membrane protein insertion porin family